MNRSWVLLLVACDGDSNDDEMRELPTSALDALEGDETEVTEEIVSTPAATATRPVQRTLPPSYTPTLTATVTPTATTPPTAVRDAPQVPEACSTFGPDVNASTREFTLGESPVIAWTAVEGAVLYRINVFDEFQNQLFIDPPLVEGETSYTIPAETFTEPGRYGWDVEPLDAAGIQMCFGRGGTLIAND